MSTICIPIDVAEIIRDGGRFKISKPGYPGLERFVAIAETHNGKITYRGESSTSPEEAIAALTENIRALNTLPHSIVGVRVAD